LIGIDWRGELKDTANSISTYEGCSLHLLASSLTVVPSILETKSEFKAPFSAKTPQI
jgi:hypothetical protein